MTDEQIRQNAEEYADSLCDRMFNTNIWNEKCYSFIAGAHSRDEEIKELKWKLAEKSGEVANAIADKVLLKQDLDKLRNSWISVKDHLPELFVDSEGITHDFSVKVLVTNENNPNYWHVAEYYPDKNEWCCLEHPTYIIDSITHWMSIPNIH